MRVRWRRVAAALPVVVFAAALMAAWAGGRVVDSTLPLPADHQISMPASSSLQPVSTPSPNSLWTTRRDSSRRTVGRSSAVVAAPVAATGGAVASLTPVSLTAAASAPAGLPDARGPPHRLT